MPAAMYWSCHGVVLSVALIWMLTTRLPSTGPSVQNPMADARPSCGLKSRMSAGVATRMMPSTSPMRVKTTPKPSLLSASGMPKTHSSETTNRPIVTMLARPYRSASPVTNDAAAPRM